MKGIKIDGEEFATICNGGRHGPFIIDVMMNTLTPEQSRRLGKWLLRAADWVVEENRKQRTLSPTPNVAHGEARGEGEKE